MYDFIKKIDFSLIKLLDDVENNIRTQNASTIVSMQIYSEFLLKYVNDKENILIEQKLSLGNFLSDNKFYLILEKDLGIDLLLLSRINNLANSHKHEGIISFDKKELEKQYRNIIKMTEKVYRYYIDNAFEFTINSNRFNDLLNEYDNTIEIIKNEFEIQSNKQKEYYESKLSEIELDKQTLEDRIKKNEKQQDLNKVNVSKLNELETRHNAAEVEINQLREEKANLELLKDEVNKDEKEKYDKEIKKLKEENKIIYNEMIELKKQDTIDISEKLDRDNKLLKEKDEEIKKLKEMMNSLSNNDKTFSSNSGVCFSSNYIDKEPNFVIKNTFSYTISKSKYKSFYAILYNILQRGDVVRKSSYLDNLSLSDKEYSEIYKLEMTILSLIKNNVLKDDEWIINYINRDINMLEYVINDIINWLELFLSLTKEKYNKPNIKLFSEDYNDKYINIDYSNKDDFNKNKYSIIDQIDKVESFNIWIDDYIKYDIKDKNSADLLIILKNIFNYNDFNQGQFEIIKHTLNGNNTIGILPTGGGKSLIYQLTALLEPKMTIVIAPINSLIKDQIDGLKKKFNITRCLNLTSDNLHKESDIKRFRNCDALFVFASPERFQNRTFREILLNLSDKKAFERIVLDEVHCLSEWGHDFRIPYLMLSYTLKTYCTDVKYLGLTATASSSVIKDLKIELNMLDKDVVFLKKLRRTNLEFKFYNFNSIDNSKYELKKIISDCDPELNGENTNAMIIFSRTKKGNETSIQKIEKELRDIYDEETAIYHGEEKEAQDDFMNNKKSILIATKAFGMGIDKPNIRRTVHFGIASSFEAFYQEAGRAGRDGKKSVCYLITHKPIGYENIVSRFLNPSTSINDLKEIIQQPLWSLDLGTNFYFLAINLDEPDKEAKETIYLYNLFVNNINNNYTISCMDRGKDNWDDEKYLYILHKIGIVNNWEKEWMSKTYTITINSEYNNIDHIKQRTKKYISQYSNSTQTLNELNNINSINELEKLIRIIRTWYFDNFVQAKRNQLANIFDKVNKYANRDCSDDIQNDIDSYFDLSNTIDEAEEGYLLTFDNDSLIDIINYISDLEIENLQKRSIEMERILESTTNDNINLYTSLLFLRNDDFNSRNGYERLIAVFNQIDDTSKVEIYENLAKIYYKVLSDNHKKTLLNTLYEYDKVLFRNVFLENLELDNVNKLFWVPFINNKLKGII